MVSADWSAFTGRWRVLVSKSNRQDTCWQAAGPAFRPSEVSAARLSRSCQFHVDSLRRPCGLLLWSVVAQEHGSTQRECRISAPGLGQRLHAHHLERWYVVMLVWFLTLFFAVLNWGHLMLDKGMANFFFLVKQILSIYIFFCFYIMMRLMQYGQWSNIWILFAVNWVHVCNTPE